MKFSSRSKVESTLRAQETVERIRSENRVKVDNLLNCVPPLSKEEQRKTNVRINVNWGEGAVIAHHARRQFYNAFQRPSHYFKVTLPKAPPEKKADWEAYLTQCLNSILKKSKKYYGLHNEQWATVVAHGIGPKIWDNPDDWCPSFCALDDLRIPTDTTTDLHNLSYFGVRYYYTPGELSRKVFGKNSMPGWNKPAIQRILKEYHDKTWETVTYDWETSPEKMAELYKQNAGFYYGEAAPSIPLWNFYYEDEEDDNKWKLVVVPEKNTRGWRFLQGDEFLYQSKNAIAKDLSELIHVQFGDLSSVAPFKYHSVRSLGLLIMEPCYWTNLFRCRLLQHAWEDMNVWLRSSDPADRARPQSVELFDRGWLKEGVSIVPRDQRHQIDSSLTQFVLANLRQLMSEASAAYMQETDTGTSKEQTAYETAVKLSMVNAMLSSLLANSFNQEVFAYREICRRFCRKNSSNEDVKKFQKQVLQEGIPQQLLNVDLWEIEPEIPVGSGNPVMEISQTKELMAARPLFGGQAQQEILHDFVTVTTGNPRRADRLVPLAPQGPSNGNTFASQIFGTLMQGVPVPIPNNLSPIDQIETLIASLAKVVSEIESGGGVPERHQLVGLNTVAAQIQMLLQMLAQNEAERPRVRMFSDQLKELMNMVKAFSQRLAEKEAAGNGNGMSPEIQGEIAAKVIKAQMDAKLKEEKTSQQMRHKEASFQQEEVRKDAMAIGDMQRENLVELNKPKPEPKANE